MTTTATVIEELDASQGHITTLPPAPRLFTVEWIAGTEHWAKIGQQIDLNFVENEELFTGVLHYVKTYMFGPDFSAWQELFGSSRAFMLVTEMTFSWMTSFGKPHLLRLWNGLSPIVRITSWNYSELQRLSCRICEEVAKEEFTITYRGFGPRGLLTGFSR